MKLAGVHLALSGLFMAFLLGAAGVNGENLFLESKYQSFVADKRAYRVGDTLVLLIEESSAARSQSERNVDRDYGVSAGFETNGTGESAGIAVDVDRAAADSRGRAGNLRATMTVNVVAIDEVGNLEVSGEQRIVLNGEEQLIAVQGVVRPIDVASDNSVLSSRLANARIEYDGYNVDGEGEKRNWLYRSLSKIGLI